MSRGMSQRLSWGMCKWWLTLAKGYSEMAITEKPIRLFKKEKSIKNTSIQDKVADFCWVDEFITNVKSYIRVRAEDNLLIKMPNHAYQINAQGVNILKFLIDGGTINQLLDNVGRDKNVINDICLFLYDVRRCLEGTLQENNHTCAVEIRPLELNFSKFPVLSEVSITSKCNLRCAFCYAGCSFNNSKSCSADMDTKEVETVLYKIFNDAKVPSVSFTGGEPALRKDLVHLVKYAKQIGFRVNLITNGTLITSALAKRLAEAGLDSAQVSIEGISSKIHDSITGVIGSFYRSVEAVRNIHSTGVLVHTNTTLNRINLCESKFLPQFVREILNLEKFSMNFVIPSGTASINDNILLKYSELKPILEDILNQSKQKKVEFMWYSPTPICLFNPIIHNLGNKGCAACDGLLSIDSNGDILPCSSYKDPLGNLLTDDFNKIWESYKARTYRLKSLAHPQCRNCDNFPVCHGACPIYWAHFGFSELCEHKGFGHFERNILNTPSQSQTEFVPALL